MSRKKVRFFQGGQTVIGASNWRRQTSPPGPTRGIKLFEGTLPTKVSLSLYLTFNIATFEKSARIKAL